MKSIEKLPSRYKIERKLGEGGFGEVFKAYDSHLKLALAIKLLPDSATSAEETLTREFDTLFHLQHPNLVRVFDYGVLPPHTPYFTMELVEGNHLRNFLRDKAYIITLPIVISQALNALIYLNMNRILHGDIKPENIVIVLNEDRGITTKLLDFGLTSSLGDERRLLSGTIRYLAPEILLNGKSKSPATDLYSLGMSLIESVLSIEVPRADEIDKLFYEKRYADLNRALASAGIKNPSALSSFILDLCRFDPGDRMRDAKEANRSLEMIATELSPHKEIRMNEIFVGRKNELTKIDNLLTPATSEKRVIIVSGAQGIGKKSILGKAAQSAQLKGLLPMNLTGCSSHFSIDQLTETLSSHLSAKDKKYLCSKLPAWARAKGDQQRIDPDPARVSVIFAHIIDFLLEMSSSQAILILASDIERGSEDFLLFIVQLLKQMEISESQISIILTTNSSTASRTRVLETLNRIARSPLSETINVQPFNDALLKEYLTVCFTRTLLPKQERSDVISKTQGLPLLIAAFLKNLINTNVIQYEDGYWILDRKRYKQVGIRGDLDNSLAITLRDVSEDQMALLRLMALKGPILRSDLTSFAPDIIEDAEQTTAGLIEKAILVYRGDGTISLTHPLYAQHIIENTPTNILLYYSGRLADRLVSEGSSDSLRIAQLYMSAERVNDAIQYGLEAIEKMYSSYLLYDCLKLLLDLKNLVLRKGNESQVLAVLDKLAPIEHKTGLPKEAINDYNILANSAPSDVQKATYYMQLADVHFTLLGNIKNSQAMLRKALRLAIRAGDFALASSIYRLLALQGLEKSTLYHEKAADLSKNEDINLHLISLASLAYSYQLSGKTAKALEIKERVIREMHKADSAAKKKIYTDLYCLSFDTADYKTARYYIMKRIQLEKKTENSMQLVSCMSSLGGCFYTEGAFYSMIDTLKEAYNAAIRYSYFLSAIIILSNLSLGYRSIADYRRSLKMLLQADELIRREDIQALNAAYLNKPTMLYLMLGKGKEHAFESSARRLHERALKTNNSIGLGHHSMAYGLHHQYRLEPDEALPHVKKALSLFRKAADRDDVVNALILTAIIQISRGKSKLAETHLREAEKLYDTIHCEYLKPLLMLGKGMLARVEHSDGGGKILSEAIRTSKKMGTRETTWQIQREFALYHKDRGEPHKTLSYYKDAVETIKQITETIDEEALKLSYLEVPFRRRVFDEIKRLK